MEEAFEKYLAENYERLIKKFKSIYGEGAMPEEMESWAFEIYKEEHEK